MIIVDSAAICRLSLSYFQKLNKKRKNNEGFTLVEIMIVVAIIALFYLFSLHQSLYANVL